jgi:nitrogen-specific signal transduction histidine kinase
VFVKVQEEFNSTFKDSVKKSGADSPDFFNLTQTEIPGLLVGDISFLSAQKSAAPKILLINKETISPGTLFELGEKSPLYVVDPQNENALEAILAQIRSETEKSLQVKNVKNEIQKKRKELEFLNNELSSESERKIQFLEKSHIEETEKNQNEKSLLHFLDFIQSESISDDFPEKLFRFIWKDLKKNTRIYTIGLATATHAGKAKISFYDGLGESTTVAAVDFANGKVSTQLAGAWGRPVGKILSWPLPEFSRASHLFLEVVDQQTPSEKINAYITERLAVLAMYLDRWMIEKEIEAVVDRWKNTFKSFSGYTHVIDENFKIYHSNYPKKGETHCYKALANRTSPCENCPVVKNKNTTLQLKENQTVKTYFSQFKFETKKYYFVIYEDITKINQLHSQIIQTEKMSTLGRLGNHLAHELNNPLTGIKSYVQTVIDDEDALKALPGTAKTDLNEILKAAVRCQKIIKNFIEFSQKKEPVLEETTFNEVLQNTLILLKTALRNHRLFIDLKDEKIKANAHDLQQVLFNIIKNACQAMPAKGSVKIYQEVKGNKIHYHIEDTGPGFDEVILKNMFQPFQTTKAQGDGTGLGLYLSKKLINNMGAELQVTSQKEKGAKVTIIFDIL